jgi:hypothetical protein
VSEFYQQAVTLVLISFTNRQPKIVKSVSTHPKSFLFSGHEPIYFIENKEKKPRGTQIVDYMD